MVPHPVPLPGWELLVSCLGVDGLGEEWEHLSVLPRQLCCRCDKSQTNGSTKRQISKVRIWAVMLNLWFASQCFVMFPSSVRDLFSLEPDQDTLILVFWISLFILSHFNRTESMLSSFTVLFLPIISPLYVNDCEVMTCEWQRHSIGLCVWLMIGTIDKYYFLNLDKLIRYSCTWWTSANYFINPQSCLICIKSRNHLSPHTAHATACFTCTY